MIERSSPVPLYYQLKELLRDRILSGELKPGDMLPTEEQLQETYDVSRTTVRLALKELEFEGLITRFRGRGTFVARPKVAHSPEPRFSLTEQLRRQGSQPGWKVLQANDVPAPGDVAQELGVPTGTSVFCLERLRLADQEPIGHHVAYVAPIARDAIRPEQFTQGGSLAYLEGYPGLLGSRARRVLEAVAAAEHVARHLGVAVGSPLLRIRRVVWDGKGTPIEVMWAHYRGDRFQYQIGHGPDDERDS